MKMNFRSTVLLGTLITAFLLFMGFYIFFHSPSSNVSDNRVENCPSSLKSCGAGCIPLNTVCCDEVNGNSYCMAPNTACSINPNTGIGKSRFLCKEDGKESDGCEVGQISCGILCIKPGEKCCLGGVCAGDKKVQNTTVDKSTYEGTYTGTFIYEYQPKWQRAWTYTPNEKGPDFIQSNFTITLTLEQEKGNIGVYYITNVISSEPGFGTGVNGVSPKPYPQSKAILLNNIGENPQYDDTSEINIFFPNGMFLEMRYIKKSPDTGVLYNNHHYDSDGAVSASWRSNVFNENTSNELKWSDSNLLDWSLMKISN